MSRTANWLVVASVLVVAFGLAIVAYAYATNSEPGQRGWLVGELSPEAVELVRTYDAMPIMWLGEEVAGHYLTHAEVVTFASPFGRGEEEGTSLFLIYGTCNPGRGESAGCSTPVQITISGPGLVPAPLDLDGAIANIRSRRDEESPGMDDDPRFWFENGVVLKIKAPRAMRAEVIAALRSANHEAMGYAAVEPGEPLTSASQVSVALKSAPTDFSRTDYDIWTGTDEFGYGER